MRDTGFFESETYVNSNKSIAENLHTIRLNEKMSRRELSELCGVSGNSIAAIETGARDGNIITLQAMAKALGYNIVLEKIQ